MIFRGFFVKINGCRGLAFDERERKRFLRYTCSAPPLRTKEKRKRTKRREKKVDMVTLNMNNLGLNNIPIPQDLSVFVV